MLGSNLGLYRLYHNLNSGVRMNIGDLVIRKVRNLPDWELQVAVNQRDLLGHGVILTKQHAGSPEHPCVSVYYPKVGKIYDIAESLMEVISECR